MVDAPITTWMLVPLRRYADFSGRSRRKEFWSFALFNVVIYMILAAITFSTGTSHYEMFRHGQPNPMVFISAFYSGSGLLFMLWWLFTIIPSTAVTVRRFHDRDMSGWWYLLFIVLGIVPLIGFIASIVMIVILFTGGTRGTNRFGPDPKGPPFIDVEPRIIP